MTDVGKQRAVWRYALPIDAFEHTIDLPRYSPLVHAAVKRGDPRTVHLWFEIAFKADGEAVQADESRRFRALATGEFWPSEGWIRIATCMDPEHDLVWHVIEEVAS